MRFVILVMMVFWIGQIFRQFPKDLREFRATDQWTVRALRLMVWAVTVYFCVAALFLIRLLAKALLERLGWRTREDRSKDEEDCGARPRILEGWNMVKCLRSMKDSMRL